MATYKIKAQYEYEGEIEANSPEDAEQLFLAELNDHYSSTYDYECVELCDECREDKDECLCDDDEEGE